MSQHGEALAALRDLLSLGPIPIAVCRMQRMRNGSRPEASLCHLAYDATYDLFHARGPELSPIVLRARHSMQDLAAAVRERLPDAVLLDEFPRFLSIERSAGRQALRILRQILRSAPVHLDRIPALRCRIEAILLLEELSA